jgi:hypothetical protein
MPRKRPPTAPLKHRAKIDTAEQINFEIKKLYRLQRNKQITAAEAKSQRDTLVALRAGLPNPIEKPKPEGSGWMGPPIIYSVPSGCFLTKEQAAAVARGESIFDPSQCELMQFDEPAPPQIEHAPRLEPEEQYKEPAAKLVLPAPEIDPIRELARAQGWEPLPRRPPRADW